MTASPAGPTELAPPRGGTAPPPGAPAARGRPRRPAPGRAAIAIALAGALAALTLLAPTAPTYDPWAWIIWGREIVHLDLDTVHGPSWKPLPVLLTAPLALAGDAAPEGWVLVARWGGLLALLAAAAVAARLAGPGAGLLAALGLALTDGFVHGWARGNSEGLLVAAVLGAVYAHGRGRRGAALALTLAAGLLRPEVWPLLGAYALWLGWRDPRLRPAAALALALVPVLWLGPEWWGSGDPLRASSRALEPNPNSPAFADRPWLAVLERAAAMPPVFVLPGAAAALALALAAVGRRRAGGGRRGADPASARPVLGLGLTAGALVALVAVMTERGYAGNPRYLALPVALACVLGGAGVVRALTLAPRRAALPVALVAAALAAPALAGDVRALSADWRALRDEAALNQGLPGAVRAAGGAPALRSCGALATAPYQVPVAAWTLQVHIRRVGLEPRAPGTVLRPRAAGEPAVRPPFARRALTTHWEIAATCPPPESP